MGDAVLLDGTLNAFNVVPLPVVGVLNNAFEDVQLIFELFGVAINVNGPTNSFSHTVTFAGTDTVATGLINTVTVVDVPGQPFAVGVTV
jgi:hypothetical protein